MSVLQLGTIYIIALIYVEKILLLGNDNGKINEVKEYLQSHFRIKDLGTLKYFLGIQVARSEEGFVLSQRIYTINILKDSAT